MQRAFGEMTVQERQETKAALRVAADAATEEKGATSFQRITLFFPPLMNIIFDYVEVKQLPRFLHAFRSDVRLRFKWVAELLPYTRNGHTLHTFDTRDFASLYEREGIYMQDLHRWVYSVGLVCPKMDTYVTSMLRRTDADIRPAADA